MPVVTIHSLDPADDRTIAACLQAIVRELAIAIQRSEAGVWAYWCPVRSVRQGDTFRYFRGHCPVVVIRAREGRSEQTIAKGLEATARVISDALGLPLEDVWVTWESVPPGRVFAGGRHV